MNVKELVSIRVKTFASRRRATPTVDISYLIMNRTDFDAIDSMIRNAYAEIRKLQATKNYSWASARLTTLKRQVCDEFKQFSIDAITETGVPVESLDTTNNLYCYKGFNIPLYTHIQVSPVMSVSLESFEFEV